MKTLQDVVAILVLEFQLLTALGDSQSFCESSDPIKDVAFIRIGTYKGFTYDGAEYKKTYLASKFTTADWFGAKAHCKSFELELATFETLTEAETFIAVAKEHPFIKTDAHPTVIVDGMTLTPKSKTDWYWTRTGEKIPFTLPWRLDEPNFQDDVEYCMSIVLHEQHNLGFNDLRCQKQSLPFICQRIDYLIPIRIN